MFRKYLSTIVENKPRTFLVAPNTATHNTSQAKHMKTIKLTTKRKADSLLIESLFNPGGTLTRVKYCSGKYKTGAFPAGREIEVSDHVKAVWSEARKDSCGPYVTLYCLVEKQTVSA